MVISAKMQVTRRESPIFLQLSIYWFEIEVKEYKKDIRSIIVMSEIYLDILQVYNIKAAGTIFKPPIQVIA